jgi:hypothetical protein
VLDRKPVAIPARDVDRVVPQHRARLDDEVLQDLVEQVAHVDMTVGIRRAVVKDPERALGGGLADLPVDVHPVPLLDHVRLELRQVGLHREGGLREVERVLIVHGN